MAKCELTIELAEPDRIYQLDQTIKGVIKVQVDQDVNCKDLEVTSAWRTHGRGNVDSGTIDATTVFTGDWRAGQSVEYPFELKAGGWPPTYHGHHINVEHFVDARAKIAWAFDPKASEPIRIAATSGEPELEQESKANPWVGGCIIAFILVVFIGSFIGIAGALLQSPVAMVIVGLIASCIVGFFLIRHFMIRLTLGTPTCEFESATVSQGETIRGRLKVTPKRNCQINGISVKLSASEAATSGSGTNKTTHRHTVFDKSIDIETATQLMGGQLQEFDIEFPLPVDAAPSFDLGSNVLTWQATTRIDVPRWPDWTDKQSVAVMPTGAQPRPASNQPAPATVATQSITFSETAKHLWDVRDDDQSRQMLVEATTGMTFNVEAIVERRLLYSGDGAPDVYPDGHAVWARYPDPELPMVLYVPHDWGDEFEQMGRQVWKGRGTIIGWDKSEGRLQIKVEGI